MDINATLIGQMIVFIILVWFMMKYVWPPLTQAMQERRQQIADGLAAAEKGHRELEQAAVKVQEAMNDAKGQAAHLLEQAQQRASHVIDEARDKARLEGERLVAVANGEIEQMVVKARQQLMNQVVEMAVAGAEKILHRQLDQKTHAAIVDNAIDGV